MIVADRLALTLPNGRTLLHAASFSVPPGEFAAVLGANGAGKTTLLRTLAGIRAPASGEIFYGDRRLHTMNAVERAKTIAHVTSDDAFLEKLTVADVVATGRYAHHAWWDWRETAQDNRAVQESLDAVHMSGFSHRGFDTLSSGERQRVWIALALAQEAPVLLLDEPTSHLDIRSAQEILSLLRRLCEQGKTIVCALHDLNEAAAFADKVLLLGDARMLAFDTPARVLSSDLPRQAYGVALEAMHAADGSLRVFPAATTRHALPERPSRASRLN